MFEGFAALECPRWHDGRLWFSDMHGGAVFTTNGSGCDKVVELIGPGGLGFLPDGRLLVVAQRDRKVFRREHDGELSLHADLAPFGDSWLNDMWVGADGRAYVGEMGFDVHAFGRGEGTLPCPANVYVVDVGGGVRVGADDMYFPNGLIVDDATRTLYVTESFGFRITSFVIADDGSLADRQIWAQLDFAPDGMTRDSEGCFWVADPQGKRAVRVAAGGVVLDTVDVDRKCLSCALGGDDGTTLFMCTTEDTDPHTAVNAKSSRLETVKVKVPC